MPLLSFEKRFADLVASGEKLRTFRPFRENGRDPRVGQTLFFYGGSYSARRKLGEAECTSVELITIDSDEVRVGNRPIDAYQFARDDGFESWDDMMNWMRGHGGVPFEGLLIRWDEIKREGA